MAAATTRRPSGPRPFGLVWWVVIVTLGTALSLFAPAYAFEFVGSLEMPGWVSYPFVVLAGALMGLVLGVAQGAGLHGTRIEVPRAAWALATAAGAMISWALGMLPVTLHEAGEPLDLSSNEMYAGFVAGVVALVVAVPALQWFLLRRVVRGAGWWVPVNLLAAALAAGAAWVVAQLVDRSTPEAALAGALTMGGVLAFVFALVTGALLHALARRPR